jgi:hypothetical protein
MGAQTNILVKDDAATPVEYTFVPAGDSPDSVWRTNIAAVPFEGQMRATFSDQRLGNGDWKRQIKLEVPVMETLGASGTSGGYVAPPKVAYTETLFFTHISSKRSTVADRANLLKIALGFLQGASSTTSTGTLDQASAGDAFKNAATPGPLFITAGIRPN